MNIQTIRTEIIKPNQTTIEAVLDASVQTIQERTILVVTSKIVSLCEGAVHLKSDKTKEALMEHEAELYVSASENAYGIPIAIKNNMLIPYAGIDGSNGGAYYVLWPKDPQGSANRIRKYLVNRFNLNQIGVIISDSHTTPLRWGTTGIALAHSGFLALKNYIGETDLFGTKLEVTKANICDALAAAAVVVMGEGDECTPIATITDAPFVSFQKRDPTKQELDALHIDLDHDVYAPILKRAPWKKGVK